MNLLEEIKRYEPYNDQEEQDQQLMVKYLSTFGNLLTRENEMAHFTASAWVLNKERTKVLMIYHNIYDSWAWTGGHVDGEKDLLKVAINELKEETGVNYVKPIVEDIFSLEILSVNGHMKRGKYVSSHLHLNVTYLLEVDEDLELFIKPDENSGVMWVDFNKSAALSKEIWMQGIYKKLNEKCKLLETE
ncbi:NUDIX hydrolase [Serpentinicella sp. ANB-PHB4]|uniref:NUDIX hydrolase n=1 Tax=Serpentinicella sp. ANB-PHB4 TaxID=3074076 RepID=UPI002863D94A|nr:NUDIX hydrolase [Serpentinicella sp. ANB-PHB4]MDR5658402.1 NUDIX hydrolase [Serpentinicella sp. ANB-PHB4]